jgi:hypothetical protein
VRSQQHSWSAASGPVILTRAKDVSDEEAYQEDGVVVCRVGRQVERVGEVELVAIVVVDRCRRRGDGRGGGVSDGSWCDVRCGGVRRRAREEEPPHVDGEQAAAVAAPHRHRLEQAARRHTNLHPHTPCTSS